MLSTVEITDDKLHNRIKSIINEFGIELEDFIGLSEIYFKNLDELKAEGFTNGCRYVANMINQNKWAIIDCKNITVVEYVEDELCAYRKARAFSLLKCKDKIFSFNQKLYEKNNN